MNGRHEDRTRFPVLPGVFLGVGLGGFFDGIVLHQILQWHHMATSAGYRADTLGNLELNTMLDGFFHAAAWVFSLMGLLLLWQAARRTHGQWPAALLIGTLLMGFGLFNLVEGMVDHQLLGLHHVNETVPPEQWLWWDIGFLVWGAVMLAAGWLIYTRAGRRSLA